MQPEEVADMGDSRPGSSSVCSSVSGGMEWLGREMERVSGLKILIGEGSTHTIDWYCISLCQWRPRIERHTG